MKLFSEYQNGVFIPGKIRLAVDDLMDYRIAGDRLQTWLVIIVVCLGIAWTVPRLAGAIESYAPETATPPSRERTQADILEEILTELKK